MSQPHEYCHVVTPLHRRLTHSTSPVWSDEFLSVSTFHICFAALVFSSREGSPPSIFLLVQNLIATKLGVQRITGIRVFDYTESKTYDPLPDTEVSCYKSTVLPVPSSRVGSCCFIDLTNHRSKLNSDNTVSSDKLLCEIYCCFLSHSFSVIVNSFPQTFFNHVQVFVDLEWSLILVLAVLPEVSIRLNPDSENNGETSIMQIVNLSTTEKFHSSFTRSCRIHVVEDDRGDNRRTIKGSLNSDEKKNGRRETGKFRFGVLVFYFSLRTMKS